MRLVIAIIFGAAALGLSLIFFPRVDAPDSPDGRFVLTDTANRPFAERSLRGRPYVIFFGFTNCPDVCPTTLLKLVQARRLASAEARMPILFVSVDPQVDTPARIAAYVKDFGPNIIGLSGSDAALKRAADDFAVQWKRDPNGLVTHTATSFLVDRDGRLSSTVALADPVDDAAAEMRKLIR